MHSYTIPTKVDTLKHHSDLSNRLQLDSVPEPYIYPLLQMLDTVWFRATLGLYTCLDQGGTTAKMRAQRTKQQLGLAADN